MQMDDDDFMGEIEFNLSPEQQQIVSQAITLASESEGSEFTRTNPLISIMQWWEKSGAKARGADQPPEAPEATLVQVCSQFIAAHARTK